MTTEPKPQLPTPPADWAKKEAEKSIYKGTHVKLKPKPEGRGK